MPTPDQPAPVTPPPAPKLDRKCMKCGKAIYQGVLCADCHNRPEQPPCNDAHVAPGCELFSDPTKTKPLPAPWMLKATEEIKNRCLLAGFGIAPMHVEEIIARHAPARSQTGEGVEWLKMDADSHHRMCSRLWDALGGDAITDYSTPCDVQVVKQRDEARAELAIVTNDRNGLMAINEQHRARIASLEAEVADANKSIDLLDTAYTEACEVHGRALDEIERLRAAPSAVAKDRAELADQLKHLAETGWYPGTVKDLHDSAKLLALLSQPAVAQTEAGNDMTTAGLSLVADFIHRLELLQDTGSTVMPHNWSMAYERIEAAISVLSESSPKSVSGSVPAVAGGGEDALAEAVEILNGFCRAEKTWQLTKMLEWAGKFIREYDAAIAATKAKEESPWKPKLNS